MRQHDNIATFVQSSGEITTFLERMKTIDWKFHSVAQNLANVTFCDEKVPRAKPIKMMPGIVEVAAGAKHSVVRTNQGKLYGFGSDGPCCCFVSLVLTCPPGFATCLPGSFTCSHTIIHQGGSCYSRCNRSSHDFNGAQATSYGRHRCCRRRCVEMCTIFAAM